MAGYLLMDTRKAHRNNSHSKNTLSWEPNKILLFKIHCCDISELNKSIEYDCFTYIFTYLPFLIYQCFCTTAVICCRYNPTEIQSSPHVWRLYIVWIWSQHFIFLLFVIFGSGIIIIFNFTCVNSFFEKRPRFWPKKYFW